MAVWGLLVRGFVPHFGTLVLLLSPSLLPRRVVLLLNGKRALLVPVRAILGISCIVLGAALLACGVEDRPSRVQVAKPPFDKFRTGQAASRWVRTVDGWERPDSWYLEVVRGPTLHPLVVAAGQGLVSMLGLVLFQRE
jgi:hypothetical protein